MKRILLICPSLQVGGIERAMSNLANYFDEQGLEVYFISCNRNRPFYTLNKNVCLIEPDFFHAGGVVSMIKYYPRIVGYIKKNVLKANPDAVLSFGEYLNPIVLFALRNLKIPIFISDRTSPEYRFKPVSQFLINVGSSMYYPKTAGFIAQTERYAKYISKKFDNKLNIKVINNPIAPPQLKATERKPYIIYIGRLSSEKGPDRLLEVFAQLKNREGWKLKIAGRGPMEDELKMLAKKLEIQKDCIFLGEVKEIDDLLNEAAIFVLPSRLEGFPNSLCEAMAFGVPSVCFDCIPSAEIIENGVDGFVVPEANFQAMAIVIDELIANPNLREKVAANSKKIIDRLSIDKIGNQFLQFMNANLN